MKKNQEERRTINRKINWQIRKTEPSLSGKEALLNEICNIAGIGGWEMDLITRKAVWTQGLYDIVELDYDTQPPGPDEHLEYYLPTYRPVVEQSMKRLIEDDMPMEFEAQFRTSKGNVRWCQVRGKGIRENGNCVRIFGSVQDITGRKYFENALINSEEKFSTAFQSTSNLMVITSVKEGRIIEINEAYLRLSGYTREELIGHTSLEMNIWAEPGQRKEMVAKLEKEGRVQDLEVDIKTKSGEIRTVLYSANKITIDDEPCLINMAIDITERKHAEEIISRERQEWLNMFQAIGHPTIIMDTDRNITAVNDAALKAVGYSPEKLLSKKCWEVFHKSSAPPDNCPMEKMLKSEKPETSEMEMEVLDGVYMVSCTPVLDDEEHLKRVIHIATDITERKEAEKALQESEHRFRQFFDNSPVYSYMVATDGRIIEINRAAVEALGYSRDELLKMKVIDIYSPEALPKARKIFKRWSETGVIENEELEIITKEGERRTVLLSTGAVRDDSGKLLHSISIQKDITEQKGLEQSMLRVNRALRVISQCNQALIHARDELQLLNDVCQVIVEDGAYLLAWAGYAEQDRKKTVRPIAQKGYEKGYLENANITWADTERGRGPAGKAIRTGKPFIVQDITNDPAFKPWRDEAIRRGYSSVIALPLRTGDSVFGVLTIYDKERDVFNEEEEKLLREMADDLAFGITALRNRAERDRAEEALKTEQEKLKKALSLGKMGSWEFDIEKQSLTWSDETFVLYERDIKLGSPTPEEEALYYSPEQMKMLRDYGDRAIQTGESFSYDLEVILPSGRKVYFNAAMEPVKDANGKIVKLSGYVQDVTARKKMEEALQVSEENFRNSLDDSPMAVIINEAMGKVVYANQVAMDLFGYSDIEEMRNTPVSQRHTSETIARSRDRWERLRRGEFTTENDSYYIKRKSGEERFVEAYLKRILWNDTECIQVIFHDITERKQAEDEIERLAKFPSENPNPVLRVANNGLIMYANAGSQLLLDEWNLKTGEFVTGQFFELIKESFKEQHFIETEVKLGEKVFSFFITPILTSRYANIYGIDITERKRAEESLRLSDAAFRSINESVIALDNDDDIVFWNEASEQIFGIKASEVIGRKIGDVLMALEDYPGQSRERLELLWERGYKRDELVYRTPRGNIIMDTRGQAIEANGKRYGWVILAEDITERKKAEEALRESQERMAAIRSSISDLIIVLDEKGRYVDILSGKKELIYIERDKIIGQYINKLLPEDIADAGMAAIQTALQTGKNQKMEYKLTVPAGERWFEANISPIFSADNPEKLVVMVARDITGRKQAEELFRNLAISSPVGVYIVQDGKFVYTNPQFQRETGYNEDELLGMETMKLVFPADAEMVKEKAVEMLKGGVITPYEYRTITKSGDIKWASETVASIQYRGKRAAIGSYQDITERKEMEEQLIVTDRLASIGELSAGIAHEMNNPLTGVIGYSDLLMERDDLPDDIRSDIEVVNREAKRTAEVVRNLLTFSRKHETEKKSTDINGLINNVIGLRTYEQRVHNIEVEKRLAPDLPEIMADSFRLQQVFINIVINAEYFMVESHGKGKLTIATEKTDGTVKISFTDDGPGIPENIIGHLFDPFFTTKEVGKGTGLGLSICHGIVTEHGGKISIESQPGKGTTFIVELPVA